MKVLTHDDLVKILEDAFPAGYYAGYNACDGALKVQDSSEYVNEALAEIGEA